MEFIKTNPSMLKQFIVNEGALAERATIDNRRSELFLYGLENLV